MEDAKLQGGASDSGAPLWWFFALAVLIAWPIGFVFGVDEADLFARYPWPVAFLINRIPKFAFSLAGIIMVLATAGRSGLRSLVAGLFRWRVAPGWYVLAVLGPLALYFGSALLLAGVEGWGEVDVGLLDTLKLVLIAPGSGIVVYALTRGGLGEELGLRGFALPRLQARYSPNIASLILGMFWGAWHLPVLMTRDAVSIVAFLLSVLAMAYIFTWVYNRVGGSLLIVVLLHATINAGDDIVEGVFTGLSAADGWEVGFVLGMGLLGVAAGVAMRGEHPLGRASRP